jgi:hypothetical protein
LNVVSLPAFFIENVSSTFLSATFIINLPERIDSPDLLAPEHEMITKTTGRIMEVKNLYFVFMALYIYNQGNQICLLKIYSDVEVRFKQKVITPFAILFPEALRCTGVNRPVVAVNLGFNIEPVFKERNMVTEMP